jgi:hypothetical protein
MLADEHKTVLLSILATLLAALAIFVTTIAVSGGISAALVESYVLPLLVTAFSLSIFAGVLFAKNKGKVPGFVSEKPEEKSAPQTQDE